MLRPFALLAALLATPAFAAEIECEGAFAIDSSEARLIEIYGKDNVVTGEIDGPRGTLIIATRVFDGDPAKRLVFVWWHDLADPSYIHLPPSDSIAGLHSGMTAAEVEALNGAPFVISRLEAGQGYAHFQSGTLAEIPGDCVVSADFAAGKPAASDQLGDRDIPSDDPLLEVLDVRTGTISVGYVHPDFR